MKLERDYASESGRVTFSVVGRRGNSTMHFRGEDVAGSYVGFTERPAFRGRSADLQRDLTSAFTDGHLDRVDLVYNRYVSPLTQYVRRHTLLPLREAEVFGEDASRKPRPRTGIRRSRRPTVEPRGSTSPRPERLPMLFEEYVDLSVYRALLESAASELGRG